MGFKVLWMRGPLTMGTEAFNDLSAAIAYATDHLEDMQGRFHATAEGRGRGGHSAFSPLVEPHLTRGSDARSQATRPEGRSAWRVRIDGD